MGSRIQDYSIRIMHVAYEVYEYQAAYAPWIYNVHTYVWVDLISTIPYAWLMICTYDITRTGAQQEPPACASC